MFTPSSWQAPLAVILLGLFTIVMARSNGTYWIGRSLAAGARKTKAVRLLDSRHYTTAERWLNRWGAPAVTLSFFVIGLQTMVNLAAGVTRMPMRRYLPAVIAGCMIWAVIYGTVGVISIAALEQLWAISPALVIVLGAGLVGLILWLWGRRDRPKTDNIE